MQIPVYAFTGFLDAGKTKFIQETLEDPRFNAGERTLLLAFEEGEEEYDLSAYPKKNVYLEILDQDTVTRDQLLALQRKYRAQRVVMELRDKVGAEDMTRANADFSGMGAALAGEMTPQGEAISALVALGYSQTDAAAAVARLDSALPTDGLVRGALKLLSRGV